MNAKRCKKLRWYARAQEAQMPMPMINKEGIPSTLLVYNHPRTWTDGTGTKHTFVNRTIQYNPRTSGKGFYKVLKAKNANIKGTIPFVRYMCQQRIVALMEARRQRDLAADAEAAAAAGLAESVGGPGPDEAQPGNVVSRQSLTTEL